MISIIVNLATTRRRVLAARIGLALLCCVLLAASALVPLLAMRHSRSVFHYAYAAAPEPTPGPAPVVPTPVPPLTGQLEVRSDPEGCSVYLDEVYIGRSPLKVLRLAFGSHRLELKRFPFAPAKRTLEMKKRTQQVFVELRERTGQIRLLGPAGTQVSVDGEMVGTLPIDAVELPIGPHRFDAQGLVLNWGKTIEVVESQRLTYNMATSRSFEAEAPEPVAPQAPADAASLLISSRPWSEVTWDGQEVGFAPLLLGGIGPGEHTLELSRRGYVTERRIVTLKSGQRASVNIRLNKER